MKIAIVGATGEVGRMMLKVIGEMEIPIKKLKLFASSRSKGKKFKYSGKDIQVEELKTDSLKARFDYILMSAGGTISKEFSPIAAAAGNTVIDNSSAFRTCEDIPLVVPEINSHKLKNYRGIVANPNCSTIQVVLALYPLAKEFKLKKVVICTYQSVSGSGNQGIQTLKNQIDGEADFGIYPRVINLNVIPQISDFNENGYCEEEEKMMREPKKIMEMANLKISTTTVRVPVIYGHSESVYAEFEKEVNLQKAGKLLTDFPSVVYQKNGYITPSEIGDSDDSFVCRLRHGTDKKSVAFWNVAHNIRVGAATNAVRIMKKMIELNSANA